MSGGAGGEWSTKMSGDLEHFVNFPLGIHVRRANVLTDRTFDE